MAVPDFQSLMIPLLHVSQGHAEISMADARDRVAELIHLTEEDVSDKLESGAGRFSNRLAWAKIHLERAGLLEKIRRGWFRLSPLGANVLKQGHDRIDLKFLDQFPGAREFRKGGTTSSDDADEQAVERTPEESLEAAHGELRDALSREILGLILDASPSFLEKLVVDLMLKMGYGGVNAEGGIVTPMGGDEGIDGIINEDRLGLDVIYLQAKRWERPVGRPEIQKFVGALHGKRAKKGVFICTSNFTSEAVEYVRLIDPKVILIDGLTLAGLMIDFGVGVSLRRMFEVKQIDSDYFADDSAN